MKIAMLSDIHGNSAALAVTLTEARQAGAQHLLIAGDLVGYYYDIAGVLMALEPWPRTVIGGNHERMLSKVRTDAGAATAYRERYGSALDVAVETLAPAVLDSLCVLPSQVEVELDGVHFLLCHGSPADQDEYVYPNATPEVMARCLHPGKVVQTGHTHYPMIAARDDALLVNAGSVGQPRDLGGFSSWALFDTATGIVAPRRTAYDIGVLQAEARLRDPHLPYLAEVLTRNRGVR
jgi:predicted phosphodiesterase